MTPSELRGERKMPTLLVVQDGRDSKSVFERTLIAEGYDVVSAGSCQEALSVLNAVAVDLVVLDSERMDEDVLEALGQVLKRGKKIPVVLNIAGVSHNSSAMERKPASHVVRSFDMRDLKKKVRELLSNPSGSSTRGN